MTLSLGRRFVVGYAILLALLDLWAQRAASLNVASSRFSSRDLSPMAAGRNEHGLPH